MAASGATASSPYWAQAAWYSPDWMVPSVARMAGRRRPLGVDGGGSLPNHVENGSVKVPLQLVHKVVGGVAGDGDGGAAATLQQLGVPKEPLIQGLGVPGKDGGGAVGHFGVGQDESGQVLLVTAGLGAVQHILIEDLGGLGAHAPQNAQLLFSHIRNLP